jgi:hypothetical protein
MTDNNNTIECNAGFHICVLTICGIGIIVLVLFLANLGMLGMGCTPFSEDKMTTLEIHAIISNLILYYNQCHGPQHCWDLCHLAQTYTESGDYSITLQSDEEHSVGHIFKQIIYMKQYRSVILSADEWGMSVKPVGNNTYRVCVLVSTDQIVRHESGVHTIERSVASLF